MSSSKSPQVDSKVPLVGMARSGEKQPQQLPKNKNPFDTQSNWTADLLDQINVFVGEPIETTNDFTKSKKANARYWSTEVVFKYESYESKVIKMAGCQVPYVQSASYGGDYFYTTFNKALGDAIVKAGNDIGLTVQANDDKLPYTDEFPWKTINKAAGRVGILDKEGKFIPKDLHNVLLKTEGGIRASVDIIIKLKGNTTGSNRNARTPFKIVADCSRCYIRQTRQDIPAPELESVVETLRGTRADVASDDLISELESLDL